MHIRKPTLLSTFGLLALALLGSAASAAPYYYFVEADTTAFLDQQHTLEFSLSRDFATGGPTDNAAQILSFATAGSVTEPGTSFGSIAGELKTGLTLSDQSNGGGAWFNVDGAFGSKFSYVVAITGSQFELQTPVLPGGFAAFSMFLSQANVAIMENPAGFGAATEIYRDGPPDPASQMEVSTNAQIPVRLLLNGTRSASTALNTIWTGGSGSYADAAHWSHGVPQIVNISDTVINSPAPVDVTLDRGGVARNLFLTAGNTLDLNGYGLTLSGRLINDGVVNASGTLALLFSSRIMGAGTTNVTGAILGKSDFTIEASQTLHLTSGAAKITCGGVLTNQGLIETTTYAVPITATTSIVNSGTLRASNGTIWLHAPAVVNNGLIASTGSAGTIGLNPDQLPVQTIAGSGNWNISSGINVDGKVNFTTTGGLTLGPNAVVTAPASSAGSSFTVSTLAGGANSTFAGETDTTLTISQGDASKPFDGFFKEHLKVIKNGAGTQILNGPNTHTGGTVINGGTLQANNLENALGYGTVEVNSGGTLAGSGVVHAFVRVNSGGVLAPGTAEPGEMPMFGLSMVAGSTLNVDLSTTGSSDTIYVYAGSTHIGGVTVNIANAGLTVGQTAWFFEYGHTLVSDADGTVNGETIDAEDFILGTLPFGVQGHFVAESDPNSGALAEGHVGFAVTALPWAADFNHDGCVDANDLDPWRAGFGISGNATHMQGDADMDFDVDGSDLLIWQRELGSGTPPVVVAAAVPEPTGITLALGLALFGGFVRRVGFRAHRETAVTGEA